MNKTINGLISSKSAAPCLFYPVVKEMGLSLMDVLTDGKKQKDVLLEIADKYPVSAVIRMTELWCEAKAFGMDCKIDDADFPKLGTVLYPDIAALECAVVPSPLNDTLFPLIEAVRLAVPCMKKPLIVGATGPYTLGSVLNGSEEFMVNCMTEPDIVHAFLEKTTSFLIAYVLEYKKAGASGIILAEPSIAMISPDMADDLSHRYIERIISEVQDDAFSVIYHNCGAVNPHVTSIVKLSAHAFHFGSDVDLAIALDGLSSDRIVMGNIDPQRFLAESPEQIEAETRALLSRYAQYSNYVSSTGCDLSPSARIDSISRFCVTVKQWEGKDG
ncbi:MAG: uroporphyrinogen decarboxylase family protein [bacterium]|jgi:uroporphyrinogen decarboxylase